MPTSSSSGLDDGWDWIHHTAGNGWSSAPQCVGWFLQLGTTGLFPPVPPVGQMVAGTGCIMRRVLSVLRPHYRTSGFPVGCLPAVPGVYQVLPCFGFGHPRPRPSFLPKNERGRHRMRPVSFPAWFVDDSHHPLCPVSALDTYLAVTSLSMCQQLWVFPCLSVL